MAADVVVVITEERLPVEIDGADTVVVDVGVPGPKGDAGAGGTSYELPFAFGDATPAAIVAAPAGKLVYAVELHIKTPFDGAGAQVVIGDADQADRLMTANQADVSQAGAYEAHPTHAYNINTPVTLSITPGAGASQGSGVAIVHLQS